MPGRGRELSKAVQRLLNQELAERVPRAQREHEGFHQRVDLALIGQAIPNHLNGVAVTHARDLGGEFVAERAIALSCSVKSACSSRKSGPKRAAAS
jgi:hypothetical protein